MRRFLIVLAIVGVVALVAGCGSIQLTEAQVTDIATTAGEVAAQGVKLTAPMIGLGGDTAAALAGAAALLVSTITGFAINAIAKKKTAEVKEAVAAAGNNKK